MIIYMKRRTACFVLFYMLSAIVGGILASAVGLGQPFVAIIANVCGIVTVIWMTTSAKGKKFVSDWTGVP